MRLKTRCHDMRRRRNSHRMILGWVRPHLSHCRTPIQGAALVHIRVVLCTVHSWIVADFTDGDGFACQHVLVNNAFPPDKHHVTRQNPRVYHNHIAYSTHSVQPSGMCSLYLRPEPCVRIADSIELVRQHNRPGLRLVDCTVSTLPPLSTFTSQV